jgi:diadenosine tetraphosphatase ApaH/serine/threonine PP2A family protein phosphatase
MRTRFFVSVIWSITDHSRSNVWNGRSRTPPPRGWSKAITIGGLARNEDPRCSPPYRHLTATTQLFCLRALDERLRLFLGGLVPFRRFTIAGAKCVACHAAPTDPLFRYLPVNAGSTRLTAEVEAAGSPDFLFFGHTHWQTKIRVGGTLVINPGSVGQSKDGDPSAAYAVWQEGDVELRRAAYDVEETVRAFGKTPLGADDVAALAEVLRTGGTLPRQTTVEKPQ